MSQALHVRLFSLSSSSPSSPRNSENGIVKEEKDGRFRKEDDHRVGQAKSIKYLKPSQWNLGRTCGCGCRFRRSSEERHRWIGRAGPQSKIHFKFDRLDVPNMFTETTVCP